MGRRLPCRSTALGNTSRTPWKQRESPVGAWCRERTSGRREAVLATAQSRLNECALLAAVVLLALSLMMLQATGARAQGQGILSPGDAVVTGFCRHQGTRRADRAGRRSARHVPHRSRRPLGTDPPARRDRRAGARPDHLRADALQAARARCGPGVCRSPSTIARRRTSTSDRPRRSACKIVGPDANGDGRPDRLRKGQPDAQWMAGQFGTDKGGGPGSIYRIDGRTGAVVPVRDHPRQQRRRPRRHRVRQGEPAVLRVGSRHRPDPPSGRQRCGDRQLRPRHGRARWSRDSTRLPTTGDGSTSRTPPSTWRTRAPGASRSPSGACGAWPSCSAASTTRLQTRSGRSASAPTAASPATRALELQVADAPIDSAITKIAFDGEGRMYLAQRGAIRGSYDYSVFAEPLQSSVLRYQRGARDRLRLRLGAGAEQYAIGFPPDYRNALGRHRARLRLRRERHASAAAPATARSGRPATTCATARPTPAKLGDEGPLDVHGLQGNDVSLVRPQNEPPFTSYFVDYDGQFGDTEKAGHVGDVEIWQPCHSSLRLRPADRPAIGRMASGRAFGCRRRSTSRPTSGWRRRPSPAGRSAAASTAAASASRSPTRGPASTTTTSRSGTRSRPARRRSSRARSSTPVRAGRRTTPARRLRRCISLPWEQVTIPVRVDVPDNLAKQLDCKVRNRAKILHAPSPSEPEHRPG